jgi:hypothetical protein
MTTPSIEAQHYRGHHVAVGARLALAGPDLVPITVWLVQEHGEASLLPCAAGESYFTAAGALREVDECAGRAVLA